MGDWTQTQDYNLDVICPASRESIGVQLGALKTAPGTGASPASNLALFVPFTVYTPWTVKVIATENGATVSGNIDVGVYDEFGNRLVSKGSTAQSGAGPNTFQSFDVTDTLLEPGAYYMAVAQDNTTGVIRRWNPAAPLAASCGVLEMATAFALPATATFAACTRAYIPFIALYGRTTV